MTAPGFDWSAGRYEHTAAQLLPVAQLTVERAEPLAGRQVVDVGCGTGNAALLAAARGAHVLGVDPATRLLEVARARAAEQRVDATFLEGEAARLPVADATADVVVSVFAVIFVADPRGAAAELARVLAPGGRLLLTAWLPGGAISQANRIAQEALLRVTGRPPGPPPFAWHEADALDALFAPHGLSFAVEEHELAFTAASPDDYLDREWANHPLAVAGRAILEQHPDVAATVRDEARAALAAGNEDPAAFRVTSRYVLATGRAGESR